MAAFYQEFITNRTTAPDLISLVAAVRAAMDASAGIADVGGGIWRAKKSTAFSAADIAACQSALDTAPAETPQLAAQNIIDNMPVFEKAILLTLLDELNNLREWITDFKAAIAASTSMADMKTRIAALSNTPDRTVPQAIQAVRTKAGNL